MQEAPDVLALQEMWSQSCRKQLYGDIKEKYPHKFEDPHSSYLSLGSGLSVYSKYPIERAKIHRFTHWRGHHEFFANKGFIIAKIMLDKTPVYVVTTHLQAGGKKDKYLSPYSDLSTQEIRFEQLKQIRRDLTVFIKDEDPKKLLSDQVVLLTGDLNISTSEEEYASLTKAIPTVKETAALGQRLIGTSYDKTGNVKPKTIDHILSLGKAIQGTSKATDTFGFYVSDHLGVVGQFEV